MIEQQLQEYTLKHKNEALIVTIMIENEQQQVIVFRGFTSSLTYPTPANPEDPVIPPGAQLQAIDRVKAPYSPTNPNYIQQGLSWSEFQLLLQPEG